VGNAAPYSGHLFLAGMTTVYIIVAIQFKERDLPRAYGERYANYQRRASTLVPVPFFETDSPNKEMS
jgi:protein-S-isoprenylcysteine O-methyltransferase Ste14